ncbi:dihydrolipoamide acetyltransferase family protein [Aegicerativicinus sediminis]|uniref:dihydrolipoamide acetyltransferase family protein n=1 Tax=Aegicerativicinus sediminis TaxID=2893202 RepID=UPI001E4732A4|nr:dihydrolipoamide acetyltransferase family protein [Aegicerativicinus sediminis]
MSQFEFKMPKMGESISEGTILNWLVSEGESFSKGDILVEVATDKVDNEVPAPVSGSIIKFQAKSKDVVPVGQVIAIIETSEEGNETKKESNRKDKLEEKENSIIQINSNPVSKVEQPPVARLSNNTFFSPLILSIAREHRISFEELSRIPSTGNDGRLRKSDVFAYIEEGRPYKFAESPKPQFSIPNLKFDLGEGRRVEMDRMRQMIADHMVYSKHTSPHVTAYVEADVTELVAWRNKVKDDFQNKYGEKLTFTPLFIEAVTAAIKDFPNINSSIDGTTLIVKPYINIGMATALPSGNLIVPVIKNTGEKPIEILASEVNLLSEKARTNSLSAEEVKGSTFTISNVGTFGSLMGTPIINQPEVAILALGIIKKRPEVIESDRGDEIAIRSMMYLSLSFDHRAVDGYLGGSFLRRIADNLENFDSSRTI